MADKEISTPVKESSAGSEERPLITFALFAYNQEKYIREAVEGALSQTYSPLEIILSDDCSSDRTFEIMEVMVAEYEGPHKILLNRTSENGGLAHHINSVFSIAAGEWVVMATGDDISFPERVSLLYSHVDKNCVAIRSGYHDVDLSCNITGTYSQEKKITLDDIALAYTNCGSGASYMYKAEAVSKCFPYNDKVHSEDRILPYQAAVYGQIYEIPDVLLLKRHVGDSLTWVVRGANVDDSITYMSQLWTIHDVIINRALSEKEISVAEYININRRSLEFRKYQVLLLELRANEAAGLLWFSVFAHLMLKFPIKYSALEIKKILKEYLFR